MLQSFNQHVLIRMVMPVTVKDVRWGSYKDYEGPVYWGKVKFPQIDDSASFEQKLMAVTTAAEGGHFDAVNCYDSCIMTVGVIQWCDGGQFSVCDMLGAVAERCGLEYVITTLKPALQMASADFRKNGAGKYRFFLGNQEVNSRALQEKLYLGGPGTLGTWSESRKTYAKTWAASMANIWENAEACSAQTDFTVPRLLSWYGVKKDVLFPTVDDPGTDKWFGAIKAICVSYAVNNPAAATKMIGIAVKLSKFEKWSPAWCLDICYQLVINSGIGIWSRRYNEIRETVEKLFGIELPKNSLEIAKRSWMTDTSLHVVEKPKESPVYEIEPVMIEEDVPTVQIQAYKPEHKEIVQQVTKNTSVIPLIFGWLFGVFAIIIQIFSGLRRK